jgi:hypothetical protein
VRCSASRIRLLIERARATCVIVAKSARNDIGSNVVGAWPQSLIAPLTDPHERV